MPGLKSGWVSSHHEVSMQEKESSRASGWGSFASKHPSAAKWIREGGLFFLFSNLVTVLQYILIQFLPYAFKGLAGVEWSWPGIPVSMFGVDFIWNVIGYAVKLDAAGNVIVGGGLGYLLAYLIATFAAQCINFPLQRNITFRSKGNIPRQMLWYLIAWVAITIVVNSINCVWVAVAGVYMADWLYNIGTTVLTGGISMVIFFFVFKIIFPEDEKKEE